MPGDSPGSSLGMAADKCIISFKSAPQNNANKVAKQSPSKEGGGGGSLKWPIQEGAGVPFSGVRYI